MNVVTPPQTIPLLDTYYIDAINGVDTAKGDINAPLKTLAELSKRFRKGFIDGAFITVNLLSDIYVENFDLVVYGANNGLVFFQGKRIIQTSLTMDTVRPWNSSAHQELEITCNSLSSSWTASGYVGKVAYIPNGAHAGYSTILCQDVGSKTVRCPGWFDGVFGSGVASSGDVIDVVDLTQIDGNVSVQCVGSVFVAFFDMYIGDSSNLHTVTALGGSFALVRCLVQGFDVYKSAVVQLFGTQTHDGCRIYGLCDLNMTCHVKTNASSLYCRIGGNTNVYEQVLVVGDTIQVDPHSSVVIDGDLAISGSPDKGVTIYANGSITQNGYLWLRDCVTTGFYLQGGAKYTYNSSIVPAIVGTSPTTAQNIAGTTNTMPLQLPKVVSLTGMIAR